MSTEHAKNPARSLMLRSPLVVIAASTRSPVRSDSPRRVRVLLRSIALLVLALPILGCSPGCTSARDGTVAASDYPDRLERLGFDPTDARYVDAMYEETGADRFIDIVFEGSAPELSLVLRRAGLDPPSHPVDSADLELFYGQFLLAEDYSRLSQPLSAEQMLSYPPGRDVSIRYLVGGVGGGMQQLHVSASVL